MSFQSDIPIIQKIFIFYSELYLIVEKMPKKDKYTLGEKAQKTTLDLMELALKAGYADKTRKVSALDEAAVKLDLLKLLIRLAEEIKSIPTNKYLALEEKLNEIGRMLGGWIKSLR